jgi:hypothetical protein
VIIADALPEFVCVSECAPCVGEIEGTPVVRTAGECISACKKREEARQCEYVILSV